MRLSTTGKPTTEGALTRTTRIKNSAAYYSVFLVLGLINAALGPTLPGLTEHTHSTLSGISYLFTAGSVGYMIGSLLGGRLFDSFHGHSILTAALAGLFVLVVLVPTIPELWLLIALKLVMGISAGTLEVGSNTLLIWLHGSDSGPWINALHFFYGVGAFLSPVIVAQAIQYTGDITWAYWFLGLLIIPALLWLIRLPSPSMLAELNIAIPLKFNWWLFGLIAGFFGLYNGAEAAFGGWIYTYAVRLGLSDPVHAAYLNSVFWGALTVGRLLSIPLALRVRARTLLWIDLTGCLFSVGFIILLPQSSVVAWIGTFATGMFLASIFPLMFTFASQRLTLTGRITSYLLVGSSLGSISLPWLIGQFIEGSGPRVTMLAILIDFTLLVVVFTILNAGSRIRNQVRF